MHISLFKKLGLLLFHSLLVGPPPGEQLMNHKQNHQQGLLSLSLSLFLFEFPFFYTIRAHH